MIVVNKPRPLRPRFGYQAGTPNSRRVSPKQTQHLLPLHALSQFRPALDQCGGGDAPEFLWLDLVQAAAADAALAAQLVAGHLGEKAKHVAAAFRVLAEHGGQAFCG